MVGPGALRELVEALDRDPEGLAPVAEGTRRVVEPAQTLARVRPLLSAAGITRVAMVTGLDDLGVPVAMAVRPNAWSLAVSQGKGPTVEHAKASAIMEAFELHCAERAPPPSVRAPFSELVGRALDPAGLALDPDGLYTPELPIGWAEGVNLRTGEPLLVPHALVHCDYRPRPDRPAVPCFLHSSNGLASGNHLAEALVHGLCELIERDSTARAAMASDEGIIQPRVDLDTARDGVLRGVIARILAAGAALDVRDETGPVGVPSFSCRLYDPSPPDRLGWMGSFLGWGCHLDPEIAVLRAVTEAAQGRLTYISGARDDLRRHDYAAVLSAPSTSPEPAPGERRVNLGQVASSATGSLGGDLAALLDALAAVGVGSVAAVNLSGPLPGVAVTRVLAPGLALAADGRMAVPPWPGGAA